eukprot:TRINITY_DN13470_c0_g1_i1.p2 TRINITY_DN13470_c0_g1~~TRINITY_DN13470_c0_g1_i1.p2  ORF type:complete len:187 (+),score=54.99 TRINITY_DN13470_c0_g1_i1:1-561(+)
MSRTGVVTGGDYFDIGSGGSCLPYSLKSCAHHVPATSKDAQCPSSEHPAPKCAKQCSESAHSQSYSADTHKSKAGVGGLVAGAALAGAIIGGICGGGSLGTGLRGPGEEEAGGEPAGVEPEGEGPEQAAGGEDTDGDGDVSDDDSSLGYLDPQPQLLVLPPPPPLLPPPPLPAWKAPPKRPRVHPR